MNHTMTDIDALAKSPGKNDQDFFALRARITRCVSQLRSFEAARPAAD
jgi:hypothetical protein